MCSNVFAKYDIESLLSKSIRALHAYIITLNSWYKMAGIMVALPACTFVVCAFVCVYKYFKPSLKATAQADDVDEGFDEFEAAVEYEEMSGDTNDVLEEESIDSLYFAGPDGDHNIENNIATNLATFARARQGLGDAMQAIDN